MVAAPEALRTHWKLLLIVTLLALIGIQVFDLEYNKLQTAADATAFRRVLDDPARAVAATLCDMVFAAGYGILGLVGVRAMGAPRTAARLSGAVIAASALFDELENVMLVGNILRRRTLTDGWIFAMRVPGTLKWIGSPVLLVVLVVLIRRAVSAPRR